MLALLASLAASDIIKYNVNPVPGFTDLVYLKNGLKDQFSEMKSTLGPMQTFSYYDKDGNVQTGGMWTIQQINKGDPNQYIAFVKLENKYNNTSPDHSIKQTYIIRPIKVNQKICGYDGFMAWMHRLTPLLTWDSKRSRYIAHVFYVDRMGNVAYIRINDENDVVVKSSCDKTIKNRALFVQEPPGSVGWGWQDFDIHTFVRPGEAHPESKEGFLVFRAQGECIPSSEAAKSLTLVTFDLASATISNLYVEKFLMRRQKTKDHAEYSFAIDPSSKNFVLTTSEPTGSRDEYYYTSIPLKHQIWINAVLSKPVQNPEFTSSYKDIQQNRNKVSYPRIKVTNPPKSLWTAVEANERKFGLYAGYASSGRFPYNTYGPSFVYDGKVSVVSQLYSRGPYDYVNDAIYITNSSEYGIRMIPYSPTETAEVKYDTPYADILVINLEAYTSQTNATMKETVDNVGKSSFLYFPGPILVDKQGNPVLNSQMMQWGLGSCSMDKFTLKLEFGSPVKTANKVAYRGYYGQTYDKGSEPNFIIDDQKDPPPDYHQIPDVPPVIPSIETITFPPIPPLVPVPKPEGVPQEPKHYCVCDADPDACYSIGCLEQDEIVGTFKFYSIIAPQLQDKTKDYTYFVRLTSIDRTVDQLQSSQWPNQNFQIEGVIDGSGKPASYFSNTISPYKGYYDQGTYMIDFTKYNKRFIIKNFYWMHIGKPNREVTKSFNFTFNNYIAYDIRYCAMTSIGYEPIIPSAKVYIKTKSFDVTYDTLMNTTEMILTKGKFEYTKDKITFYAYPTSSIIIAANAVRITDNDQVICVRKIPASVDVKIMNIENAYVTYSDTIPEEELYERTATKKAAKVLAADEKIRVEAASSKPSKLYVSGDYWPQTSSPITFNSPEGCELHQSSFATVSFTEQSKLATDFNSLTKIPDFNLMKGTEIKMNTLGMVSKIIVGSDKVIVQSGPYKIDVPYVSFSNVQVYNSKSDVYLKVDTIRNPDGSLPNIPETFKITGDEGTKFIIDESINLSEFEFIEIPHGSEVQFRNLTGDDGQFERSEKIVPKTNTTNVGAIVGGVIAALVVVAVGVGVFIFMKKKKQTIEGNSSDELDGEGKAMPLTSDTKAGKKGKQNHPQTNL